MVSFYFKITIDKLQCKCYNENVALLNIKHSSDYFFFRISINLLHTGYNKYYLKKSYGKHTLTNYHEYVLFYEFKAQYR